MKSNALSHIRKELPFQIDTGNKQLPQFVSPSKNTAKPKLQIEDDPLMLAIVNALKPDTTQKEANLAQTAANNAKAEYLQLQSRILERQQLNAELKDTITAITQVYNDLALRDDDEAKHELLADLQYFRRQKASILHVKFGNVHDFIASDA